MNRKRALQNDACLQRIKRSAKIKSAHYAEFAATAYDQGLPMYAAHDEIQIVRPTLVCSSSSNKLATNTHMQALMNSTCLSVLCSTQADAHERTASTTEHTAAAELTARQQSCGVLDIDSEMYGDQPLLDCIDFD